MAPFGYLPVDASRYWFIFINTVATELATYFLLRLFNFTLSSVAAPALLAAMFCTETVTNTLVFTNINRCILLLSTRRLLEPLDALQNNHQPQVPTKPGQSRVLPRPQTYTN
jgi:arabinofuranan 3-O-arabinosyltransferase